jgi:hypothetical protein
MIDDYGKYLDEAGIVVTGEAVWKLCELIAAAEREACAKVAETAIYRHDIADAIRKRKEESEC